MKFKYLFKLGEMVKDNAGVSCKVIARCRNVRNVNTYVVEYPDAKPIQRGREGIVTAGQAWIEQFLEKIN